MSIDNITNIGSIIKYNTPDNEPENNYSDSLRNINKTSDILESEEPYGSEHIPWDNGQPQVIHSERYLSYFIPLEDGSIGFCTTPYRMRVDERDDLLPLSYSNGDQLMVLRAVSSGSGDVLLVNNSVTKKDISNYVKYLFYEYGDTLSDTYLQELYTILLTKNYNTVNGSNTVVTNALRRIVTQVDTNSSAIIPNSGATKIVVFNGKRYMRYYDFSKLVNMASWKQDVLSVMVKDIPLTDISVNKTWDDSNNQDGKRPGSITVMLFENGVNIRNVTVTAADGWKYNFTDLPTQKNDGIFPTSGSQKSTLMQQARTTNGTKITYTIGEKDVPYYTANVNKVNDSYYTIRNNHATEVTSLNVTKVWDDDENRDGLRKTVTVFLYADNVYKTSITLSESNDWKGNFTNLPVYNNGKKINYTVTESAISGYSVNISQDGSYNFIIRNNHTPKVTSLNVSKVWDDNENQDGVRPLSVTVNVLDGDEIVATKVLNADNEWKDSFEGLPVYKNNGTLIVYSIQELAVDNYTANISPDGEYGFIINNTHVPLVTTVNVTKNWDDNEDQDGVRPDNITVNLYDGDVLVATAELNADNGWKVTFEDLPVYKDNGTLIVYSVEEIEVSNYTVNMTKVDDYNFLINNTHIPLVTSIDVSKVWDDKDNKDRIRPKAVKIELYADGKLFKTLSLSASNKWKAVFDELPVMKNGTPIGYTLKEVPVDGYSYAITGDNGTYVITNTHIPHNPALKLEKITLTPKVKVGKITSFKIRVTNIGDCDLANVYVKELKHIGLVYDHFTDESGKWAFDSKSKWTFKGILAPGESAEFIVYFKTSKLGNFTNIIAAGSNETNETTTNNTTETFDNGTPHKNATAPKPGVPVRHMPNVGNPIFALIVSLVALFVPIRFRKK